MSNVSDQPTLRPELVSPKWVLGIGAALPPMAQGLFECRDLAEPGSVFRLD